MKIKNILPLLLLATSVITDAQERPNVLFIISDDMRNELNCYGADYIHSPNIDNLAKNGVIFDRAYVQQAVCSASRASFLSGCRPNTTGVDYPYSNYFVNDFWPNHPMLAEYFEQNGYYAHTFGKVHHGPSDHLKTKHYSPKTGLNTGSHYALPENIKKGGARGRGQETPPYECADVPDEAYQDGLIAQKAVNVISQQKETKEPFFIAVGFKKPHLPFVSPKKYWDLYDESKIPLAPNRYHPKNSPLYSTSHYSIQNYAGLNYYNSPNNVLPEDYQRTLIHAYAACISYIDAQVGKLITALKETGKYDNTIIVFISDHGWHLGHQQMWGKTTVFENATRAPLIVSAPNYTKGKRSTRFVEYVDIYATLCDLAGIKTPDYTEGTSFKPILKNPQKEWKKAAFSQFPRGGMEGYSIRTNEFRYTEWRNPDGTTDSIELYDHRENDIESLSIAYNEGNESILNELAKQLNAGWKAALPEGVENNSNNPIAPPHVNWSGKKIKVERKKTMTFKSGEDTKLWKPVEGYQLSVKNQLLYIDVEHDANYWKKMKASDLNVKATNNLVLKLAYKTIDNQPLTLAYHISSENNWGELSSISLPSTNGDIQEITIQLASDISNWEDKYEKMKAIEEIIFCINPKEKFKGTLILKSLTLE